MLSHPKVEYGYMSPVKEGAAPAIKSRPLTLKDRNGCASDRPAIQKQADQCTTTTRQVAMHYSDPDLQTSQFALHEGQQNAHKILKAKPCSLHICQEKCL